MPPLLLSDQSKAPEDFDHNAYMSNYQNLLEPGHVPCMTKEWKPKIAQHLERYLTPDELKKFVLKSPRLQMLLENHAAKTKQSKKEIEKQAKEILNEIGLARSLPMIRWAGMCITAISKRITSGIYVNELNLKKARDQLGSLPVLYLPSHRSYLDFVLMSYICFNYDIEIPGIAAGMDFYAMVGMGNFLRKTGAFFMRRSFSGDDLYWDIFREYVHALVTSYHIGIEFFIEGTRSRNFKALVPKIGLLAMALEPFFMGEVPDVMIVPVSVSYERVLEEKLFAYELLGVPKPKESTKGFFKALKIIEEKYGRMYVDFGEPISVKKYFGSKFNRMRYAGVSMHLQKLVKDDLALIKDLAFEIVYKQQLRIVITTFNLVAIYYSYRVYLGQKINLEQLCNGVLLLKTVFEKLGALTATEEKSIKMDVLQTIEIHSNILNVPTSTLNIELKQPVIQMGEIDPKRLKGHRLTEHIMQLAVPAISLQMYINPGMFWLSTPAIMTLTAMKLADETGGDIQKDQLRIRINELSAIFGSEFVIIPGRSEEDFYRNLNILSYFKILDVTDKVHFNRNEISDIMLSSLAPFLCCYLQVFETILEEFNTREFTDKDLMLFTQKRIEHLLTTRSHFIHPYCLSLDNIGTALASLVQNGFIEKRKISNVVQYSCHSNELLCLRNSFLQYLQLLPFTFNENCNVLSKL